MSAPIASSPPIRRRGMRSLTREAIFTWDTKRARVRRCKSSMRGESQSMNSRRSMVERRLSAHVWPFDDGKGKRFRRAFGEPCLPMRLWGDSRVDRVGIDS